MEKEGVGGEGTEVYSVWGIPPDAVRERLRKLMSALRAEFPGIPAFDPHITLVGALRIAPAEAVQRLRSAAASLSPFTAKVSAVSRGSFFYQCVYLLIDPSPEVMDASAHCCGHFGYQYSAAYMPHLSLVYADMTDEEKETARQRVDALDKEICDLSFEVSRIALYKTDTEDKSLESWELIQLCELKKD